jgi:Ca-activated chloride channel family protein
MSVFHAAFQKQLSRSISNQTCGLAPPHFMRFLALIFVATLFASAAAAQSGRQRPSPTPTPRQIDGPSILSLPAGPVVVPVGRPTPVPVAVKQTTVPDDVIRVDSVLIPIPVSVLDPAGRAVPTLTAGDFELRIDGKLAEIGEVSRSDVPIRLAMLFDNSSSVAIAREFEKEAAVRFFRRVVRPAIDKAALFSVADYTRLEQPLTSDVSTLTQAIELFPEPKGATALLDGIVEVANYLKAASGRRVIVIVSDGEDTISDVTTTLEGVIRTLQINDCQVYVVKTKDFENFKRTGVRGGNANIRALTAERRMIDIAEHTGGAVYSPIDEEEMRRAFDRISAELSQQYVLNYYPESDNDKPGDFKTISLTVKNKPNLTIRTRKGYYVAKRR